MATTSSAFRQLSDGNLVGTLLGISTTDLIGFYGVTTATAQPNSNGQSISSGALSSSLAFQLNKLGLINVTTFSA